MKTTINLPDELLVAAKVAAAERRTTLTALMAGALRRELAIGSYTLPDRAFQGNPGVRPGVEISDWEQIREFVYGP
jgi:hypothetical protein